MFFSSSGLFAKFLLTSKTTWYWFNCVNIVETCRWPNASYRVSSIACGSMPSREALSRSITSVVNKPEFCWSVATSRNSGRACSLATMRGVQ